MISVTTDPIGISAVFLDELKRRFLNGSHPHRDELIRLLQACCHPRQDIREKALTLLLHPPVDDETMYRRWLFEKLWKSHPLLRRCPLPVLETLCEWIAFSCEVADKDAGLRFSMGCKALPRELWRQLLTKPLRLAPFLPFLHIKHFNRPRNRKKQRPGFIRRWHYLCKQLRSASPSESWQELTFRDLRTFWYSADITKRRTCSKARWLMVGRLLLRPKPESTMRWRRSGHCVPSLIHCHWNGLGYLDRIYLDALLERMAAELRSVRDLAIQVSRNTRRVVLSWHNATLAASGGWAFESICHQFPSIDLWLHFKERLKNRLQQEINPHDSLIKELQALWLLWEKRIVQPKLEHATWEYRLRNTTVQDRGQERKSERAELARLANINGMDAVGVTTKYTWTGALNPSQSCPIRDLLKWRDQRRRLWIPGWLRLRVLLQEGQRLLDRGELPYLVLPLVDKFFISSRREEDIVYLPSLVNWVEKAGTSPLILFWEDTSHCVNPSFKLAMTRTNNFDWHGFDVFGQAVSDDEDILRFIDEHHQKVRLFALRPMRNVHNPKSLQQLLENRDGGFLKHYDSSWKDNLVCLYVGTRVFPLLSVQTDAEPFAASIVVNRRRLPFGAYVHCLLRQKVLGNCFTGDPMDDLSLAYEEWANLG